MRNVQSVDMIYVLTPLCCSGGAPIPNASEYIRMTNSAKPNQESLPPTALISNPEILILLNTIMKIGLLMSPAEKSHAELQR